LAGDPGTAGKPLDGLLTAKLRGLATIGLLARREGREDRKQFLDAGFWRGQPRR
jgi:hypothetical protein